MPNLSSLLDFNAQYRRVVIFSCILVNFNKQMLILHMRLLMLRSVTADAMAYFVGLKIYPCIPGSGHLQAV